MDEKDTNNLPSALRQLAENRELMEIGRAKIENLLIELRDSHISTLRNNGFAIRGKEGSPPNIIRLGTEQGVRIALLAIADEIEKQKVK